MTNILKIIIETNNEINTKFDNLIKLIKQNTNQKIDDEIMLYFNTIYSLSCDLKNDLDL